MNALTALPVEFQIVVVLIIVAAGFVHGALGLGFPLVATPLLALLLDVRSAILITLLPTAVVNVASVLQSDRWLAGVREYWPIATYAVIGSSIGTWVIATIDPAPFQLLLALLTLLFLASHYFNPTSFAFLSRNPGVTMPLVGLVAGFAAGTTNVMVPVLIIYSLSLSLSKNTMVQMFNLCFLSGKLSQMLVFGLKGTIGPGLLLSTAPLALAGFCALLVGVRLRDRIPSTTFRKIVRGVLFLLAILLILQVILGWKQ